VLGHEGCHENDDMHGDVEVRVIPCDLLMYFVILIAGFYGTEFGLRFYVCHSFGRWRQSCVLYGRAVV
jgi:hypothetical protein